MKINKILALLLGIVSQINYAQIVDHQDITLPTPSISSSITNYDVDGSSLAYGLVSPSINIFTIQVGDISIPISLSHSYNGFKPNELPGVLGLGWTISGGGAVSKSVHGLDDDHIRGYPKTVENYMSHCSTAAELSGFVSSKLEESGYELNHFKRLIANGTWDGLPDKYQVSGPGLHENFFQYRNSMFATFPYSSTTIDQISIGEEWVITKGDGIKYYFGEPDLYVKDGLLDIYTGKNTWKLTRIQSGNGESIEYKYGPTHFEERYQYRDAMRYRIGHPNQQESLNSIDYSSFSSSLLESIKCPNYELTYHYSSFTIETDVANDIDGNIELYQIDSIRILDNEGKAFKVISFHYKYLLNVFFLDEMKIRDQNHEVIENYEFTYNETMPYYSSYPSRNIDHWGYINGNNNSYLFPRIIGGIELLLGGNREVNPDLSQFGLLKSITLPTGGHIEYEYEKNSIYLGLGIEEIDSLHSVNANNLISCSTVFDQKRIEIPFAQEIKLYYDCYTNGSPTVCEGMGIKIRGPFLDSPTYYSEDAINVNKEVITTVNLEAGIYFLEVYSDDADFEISASIISKDCVKDENGICVEVDRFYDVGGHRIKRITQKPIYGSNIVSNILYHNSGKLFENPSYETSSVDHKYVINGQYMWPVLQETGAWITRSGNSYRTLLRGGNPMMYKKVSIEKLANEGVIKSTYDYMFHSKYGECANGSFYIDIPDKRGKILNIYSYLNGSDELITKTENSYKDILPQNEKAVIAIHQDFQKSGLNTFDTEYKIGSWCPVNDIKTILDSSKVTQDKVTVEKAFTYNINGLLESEKYLNSKGEMVNLKYIYSDRFKSKPVLIEQELNGRIVSGEKFQYNIYGQPVLIFNYYNGIGYIKSREISYMNFNNALDGSTISKPVEQIDFGIEGAPKTVISQIWSYNCSYPVIKAQNVSHTDLKNIISIANIGNYTNLESFLLGVGNFFDSNNNFIIANKTAFASFVSEVQLALPEAFITFYTYSPLKGVTSKTDPSGKTIYYQYDDSGRLKIVKDHDGNIVKNYEYNYMSIPD
jgi:YD repeat-containing protein